MGAYDYTVSSRPASSNETTAQTHKELIPAPAAGTAALRLQYGSVKYVTTNSNGVYEAGYVIPEATNFGFLSVGVSIHSVACRYHIEEV